MEIPTYSYHVDGTQRYTRLTLLQYCVIVPWCLPISTAFIPCTQCTPNVDILTWVFMYTKCILMLHITPQTGTWCIQYAYIGFHFSRLVIRPL